MVKLLFVLLVISNEGSPVKDDYDQVKRYNDSLLIFNTYKTQVTTLKALKETDRLAWYRREASDDSLTACAKYRLRKYNRQPYEPADRYERKGIGIAYGYPCPQLTAYQAANSLAASAEPNLLFNVYDKQTHFLTDKVGKIVPYIKKWVFDKGRLLYIEKLNPVTMEKL